MRILVTGGAGFIGSHIVDAYVRAGHQVAVVDKKDVLHDTRTTFRYYQQDITQPGLETIFQQFHPNVVNHHAALIHVGESMQTPTEYASTNVLATIRLLQLSKEFGVKQFLFASSVAVYGNVEGSEGGQTVVRLPLKEDQSCHPISFYGLDKWVAEQYVQLLGKEMVTTIFRYANVYGPRQNSSAEGGVVAIFAKGMGHVASRRDVDVSPTVGITIHGDGTQTRDFIFVKDIAQANLMATEQQKGELLHVSTNQETSINDLFETIWRANGCPPSCRPIYGPGREGDILRSVLANERIKKELGWEPEYTLEQGLREAVEWFAQETTDH